MQVSSIAFESCLSHYTVKVLMYTEQCMKQDIKYESRVLTNTHILAEVEYENKLEKGTFLLLYYMFIPY